MQLRLCSCVRHTPPLPASLPPRPQPLSPTSQHSVLTGTRNPEATALNHHPRDPNSEQHHSSAPGVHRSARRDQHQAAQMSLTAARGSSQAVSQAARLPSPPDSQRHPVQDSAWTPLGMGCSLSPRRSPNFHCFRECKIFPEPEPQPASQSKTCPEIHTGPPNPDISPLHPYPSVISLGIPRVNMFIYKIHRPSLPACNAWESERSRGLTPETPRTPGGAGPGRSWKDTPAPPPMPIHWWVGVEGQCSFSRS